jgi:hypothetical protein
MSYPARRLLHRFPGVGQMRRSWVSPRRNQDRRIQGALSPAPTPAPLPSDGRDYWLFELDVSSQARTPIH